MSCNSCALMIRPLTLRILYLVAAKFSHDDKEVADAG